MAFSFLEKTRFWMLSAVLAAVLATWFFAPGTVYGLFISAERGLAGLQAETLEVGPERWAYLDNGAADREVLVLLHGFSADKDNFNRLIRQLDDRFRIVAPDLLGFGASSSALDNRYTATAQAERVFQFLDAINVSRAHVGGNSMGGYVALAMARLAPERVATLWLMAPGGVTTPPLSPYVESIMAGEPNGLIPDSEEAFRDMLDLVFANKPWLPGPVVGYLGREQMARRDRLEAIFKSMAFDSVPAQELATGLLTPTLISWGELDRVLHPDGGFALQRQLRSSRFAIMEGVGHLPQLEAPEQMARDYFTWLDRLNTAPLSPAPDPARD